MICTNNGKKALVLTVGTGNIDDIERTLLAPMFKSVEDGEWDRIVLLPSRTTEEFAQTLQERIANPAVEIDLQKSLESPIRTDCYARKRR